MIDIHCHILPNIDDGPKDWDMSIEMAKMANSEGIDKIIATPHYIKGTDWETDANEIKEKVDELNNRLVSEDVQVKIYPGMEVAITEKIPELVDKKVVLKMADTDFLLLEVPFGNLPFGIDTIIKELVDNKITPILAHPERCMDFQKNPKKINRFIKLGAMIQVTSLSFSGDYGKGAKNCSIKFSKMNVIDFIATDAHSTERRPPVIQEALKDWQKYSNGSIHELIESGEKKLGL